MKKRVVVITGAGGGLGSVFAEEFAHCGDAVAVLDYDKAAAEKVVRHIAENNGTSVAVECDVTNKESLSAARRAVCDSLGAASVLINCAGVQDPMAKTTFEAYRAGDENIAGAARTFFNLDGERLARVMNVNWLGTVMACQAFAADMVGRDDCSIVNITSMAAYDALSTVPAYASSKAAVDIFTKWLSNYLSNAYGKVRVNAVAPGYFLTPLNHDMYVNPDGSYTARYYNVIRRTPMGRLGDIKELLGALRFLADPTAAGYITGQVIAVDGGFLSCPGV